MSKLNTTFMVVILWAWVAYGAILLVPSQYPTIQAGINAAVDGDTVLVADGTYTGTGNKNIDFLGKAIVVTSENGPETCIIDCQNDGRGFYFHSNEDASSVLSGFKVIHGQATSYPGGGGIYLSNSSPVIYNCIISDNSYTWHGGGILCQNSNPVISYTTFTRNSAINGCGGGISILDSSPILSNCTFSENLAGYGGGGIDCEGGSPTIQYSIINSNSTDDGGGIFVYKSLVRIENCAIYENSAQIRGGGIFCQAWAAPSPIILNCTISRNSAGLHGGGICYMDVWSPILLNGIVEGNQNGGIYFYDPSPGTTYGNFYNNEGGNFTGDVPPNLGIITTINANGDSCDTFYNVFEDPLFEDPGAGNFQITWENYPTWDSTRSPCIDAGDPDSPLDPDSTLADMGALYFDQGASVQITLSPVNPPIIIPQNGGSFSFHATVTNASNMTQTFDAWCTIEVPGGSQFTVLGPVNLTLNAGASLTRLRTQGVPASAPGGEYAYWGFVGDYPWNVTGSDHFPFVKLGGDGGGMGRDGWICSGEPFPGEASAAEQQPKEFALHGAFPNPFNPTTTISYQLSADSHVSLNVHDIAGRLVAALVDGWREAGTHEVTFDGSDLPSGIYLARLIAGDFAAVQKMVLMK